MSNASLMPIPKIQFFGNNGLPLSGGMLYTAAPGTYAGPGQTQPQATYTDSSGSVANANPVVLDSQGRANVWLSGFYKMALYDSQGNLIWTEDNVSGANYNTIPITTAQVIPVSAPAAQNIITLPVGGGEFIYIRTDVSQYPVTLVPGQGGQTVCFQPSYDLTIQGESVHLLFSSGNWYKI